jgi:hypothetical protein
MNKQILHGANLRIFNEMINEFSVKSINNSKSLHIASINPSYNYDVFLSHYIEGIEFSFSNLINSFLYLF